MLIERIFGDEIFRRCQNFKPTAAADLCIFLKYVFKSLKNVKFFSLNAADVGTFVHMVFENICKNIEADKNRFCRGR
ncbi:MAG: hypothetical protein L6V93_07520 [Clostridiales bacterium]|nr:MAG: hypothetical protein L6V93_07520 [Clostridiales bacterium]